MSFKTEYQETIRPELIKENPNLNVHEIPKLDKIVINVGAGEAATNKSVLDKISADLLVITGQKPVITTARRSVAGFKIRKGLPIGVKVNLRNKRMYDFYEKLTKVVLPRLRDFRGISHKNFDGRGNLNIGLTDQTLFPEIEYDKIDRIRGLEITIVTTAKDDSSARQLLEKLGLPFEK